MDSSVRQKSALDTLEIGGGYLPTPQASEADRGPMMGIPGARRQSERTLSAFARSGNWPTPLASDPKHMGHGNLSHAVGGKLNPGWVEWLMGYPLEWTALEDWVMQWFRNARKKRLKY